MESLCAASTRFSLDLFTKICGSNKDNNIVFSPLSLHSTLAMVLLGARGDTAAQMAQALRFTKAEKPKAGMLQQVQKLQLPVGMKKESLHFHEAEEAVHVGFEQFFSMLNKHGVQYSLSLANRLYGEKSYQFVEKFLADCKKFYKAELEPVDFNCHAEAARVNINTWVEKQTKEKIKNLLAPGVLDSMTRLVLVNAVYFKGKWQKKFDSKNTREMPFHISKSKSVPVKMMEQKARFGLAFIDEANCQVLEMPYVGDELSMFIMLPSQGHGLEWLEKNLTYDKLMEWTAAKALSVEEVVVTLPRFKLEETYDMKQILSSMGIVDAFDKQKSDFSAMSPNNDLVLSKVVHKVFMEVNEEGTEAAAATAAIMMTRCLMVPATFTADHPFLFFIRHNPTKIMLFHGRFSSP